MRGVGSFSDNDSKKSLCRFRNILVFSRRLRFPIAVFVSITFPSESKGLTNHAPRYLQYLEAMDTYIFKCYASCQQWHPFLCTFSDSIVHCQVAILWLWNWTSRITLLHWNDNSSILKSCFDCLPSEIDVSMFLCDIYKQLTGDTNMTYFKVIP